MPWRLSADALNQRVVDLLHVLVLLELVDQFEHFGRFRLTELGRTVITAGLKLKNLVLIPELARALPV